MRDKLIYLDNNATTQIAPEVADAMLPYLKDFYGNPSSAHVAGRAMNAAVTRAREQVAALLNAAHADEIVFTSCGSESDNWALRGALEARPDKKHIVTTRVEHEAVRVLCERLETQDYEITWLGVDSEGLLNLEELRAALRPDTAIVSIMLAQNETGVLFPLKEIAKIVRAESDALLHVDAVQAVGKIPVDVQALDVDLLALSGHKLHAPQGVGAMYVRRGVEIAPYLVGGKQESKRRAGTLAVPNIVALGAACELAMKDDGHADEVRRLRDKLEDGILQAFPNARLNGTADRDLRLPNTAHISFQYIEGESVMACLDDQGICVSTGSACHSTSHEISSAALKAMNVPFVAAQGSIRFSLGRYNTEREIDTTLAALDEILPQLIAMSPYQTEVQAMRINT